MIQKTLKALLEELGKSKVTADPDILSAYSVDESSDLRAEPDILVRAENTADVSATMRICNRLGTPVIPRGAGSGVTGGAVAVRGGVVLSLEKMNRILEIDCENMAAVVEPGVITADIQKAAAAEGLMYPPDPASLDICSIGGNVAENAGGPRAVRYGITGNYVIGLELVLPDGSVINTGGKFVKNATGYNLIGIIIGSEGTLAVVTRITLRLIPAPLHSIDLLIPFESIDSAINTVHSILMSRVMPSTIEFMEAGAIDIVSRYLGRDMPFPDARAHLLLQIDAQTGDEIDAMLEKLSSAVPVEHDRIIVAQSPLQQERLWKARRSIREAIHALNPVFLAEDCVVPRSRIPDFIIDLKKYFKARGLVSVIFGHAGDGNVHIDVIKGDMDYDEWLNRMPELKKEIYSRALARGGTITGEHGIGCVRREYLPMALSDAEIRLQSRIKRAFDPNMILNPGKIFPDDYCGDS